MVVCTGIVLVAACSRQPETPVASATAAAPAAVANSVSWVEVKDARDVEAAFAQARDSARPVFLYWGAAWCPPCNQVKSTIFTRADFVAQSRRFVPVYLDGDTPGAQRLGKRLRVSAYPTMILLRADGTEVTRLAGAVEPAKYLQLLAHGLSGGQTARQALAAALRGDTLAAEDWRLLAYYSWETDEQQLVPGSEAAATLARLARRCPAENRAAAARLALQAIAMAAADAAKQRVHGGLTPREALALARDLIATPGVARAQFDIVTERADDIVGYATAPRSAERKQLVGAWLAALEGLTADASLPRAAPLWTVTAKLALLRLDENDVSLPAALLEEARSLAARADRETADPNERQSVISSAAHALLQAGLLDDAEALLKAELGRSHSPYYHMLGLAAIAKKRGDAAAAIAWAKQAFDAARGRATRLQWGARYVAYLVELAPNEKGAIEVAALRVLAELTESPDEFFARNRSVLERMHRGLTKWSGARDGEAVLARLREAMRATCARLSEGDPDRAACSGLFARVKA